MASTVTELLRRRFGGKALPYDAEIEYLGGADGTLIDTGIVGDSTIEMDIVYSLTGHTNYAGIYGNYIDENHSCTRAILTESNNTNAYVNVGQQASKSNTITGVARKVAENHLIANSTSITINGTTYSPTWASGTKNTTNIALYNSRVDTLPSGTIGLKIMSCKIKQSNVLVRDFIPVRVGTTGYMYDKVSKQLFGNAGTGSFILGDDI